MKQEDNPIYWNTGGESNSSNSTGEMVEANEASDGEVRPFDALVILRRKWAFAKWLVRVRKALRATGHFENGVYPDPKSWYEMYYKDKYTPPNLAVEMDMPGVTVPIRFDNWNGKAV